MNFFKRQEILKIAAKVFILPATLFILAAHNLWIYRQLFIKLAAKIIKFSGEFNYFSGKLINF